MGSGWKRLMGAMALAMTAAMIAPMQQAIAAGAKPGDFNGDGRGDLAIGVPGEDVGGADVAGAVNVLYGRATGLSARGDEFFSQANLDDDPEVDDRFGAAVAPGDFDGDGYSDLAIGVPGESSLTVARYGAVHVVPGSASGLTTDGAQFWDQDTIGVDANGANDALGSALAAGDWNDDGFADLAIGHPGEAVGASNGAGAVTVLYGSEDGLAVADAELWSQDSTGIADQAESGTEGFGSALARRDFDHDGIADLAIGVPGEMVGDVSGGGAVNVLYGTTDGLDDAGNQLLSQDVDGVRDEAEANDAFGSALAAGDFDHDGYGDLAIGVPGERIVSESSTDGAVAILYGRSTGITGASDNFLHQDAPGIRGAIMAYYDEDFGAALAAGDFDRDGRDDLAIGVPSDHVEGNNEAGVVQVLFGSAQGINGTGDELWHENVKGVPGAAQVGDAFGASLAARNMGQGGAVDLAVGVPNEDSGTSTGGGRVHVFYGSAGGLKVDGNQKWEQDTPGVQDDCENGDAFGSALG